MYVLKKFYYKYVLLFLKNDNVSTIASCVEEWKKMAAIIFV